MGEDAGRYWGRYLSLIARKAGSGIGRERTIRPTTRIGSTSVAHEPAEEAQDDHLGGTVHSRHSSKAHHVNLPVLVSSTT